MKVSSIINLTVFNGIGIFLAALVAGDQAWRLSYWHSLGFTPNTTYYPFFLITSATKGSDTIPGQLTIDWLQVLVVVLVIVDLFVLIGYIRRKRATPVEVAPAKTQ